MEANPINPKSPAATNVLVAFSTRFSEMICIALNAYESVIINIPKKTFHVRQRLENNFTYENGCTYN